MHNLLILFILIPIPFFILTVLTHKKREQIISFTGISLFFIEFIFAILFIVIWIINGIEILNFKQISLYKNSGYEFFIQLYFDKVTAVYLLVGSLLSLLIAIYAKTYLHLENGYKRFYATIILFYTAYNIIVISGNLETLFIGWEVLGISSFLLIGFYRQRYLPVKNALKIFTLYRVGDLGIIIAIWLSHHIWHKNITYIDLTDVVLVEHVIQSNHIPSIIISLFIILSAFIKSAQFPFSYWLPRAMEGPTPSTAIFYGSLAVHMGSFLLIRTSLFWEHILWIKILIIVLGTISALTSSIAAKIQSSVKAQIGYASIAQQGIIFIEIALGLENIALLHFVGNAFFRSYQLLVSPSIITYFIREQMYEDGAIKDRAKPSFFYRIQNTIYTITLMEWNIEKIGWKWIWNPIKTLGEKLTLFDNKITRYSIVIFCICTYFISITLNISNHNIIHIISYLACIIGLLLVIISISKRNNALLSWKYIIYNHLLISTSISNFEKISYKEMGIYITGILFFGIIGYILLKKLNIKEKIHLQHFQGLIAKYPSINFIFLICCLGISGFPISPTFIGVDLIYTHIDTHHFFLAFIISLSYILHGVAAIKIYSKIFLGPNKPENLNLY